MADLTGKTLGNYRIVERIGQGGMATVYKAYQPALERYVAIKVIHEQLVAGDEKFLKRFQREAKAVAALRHSNICTTEANGSHRLYDYYDDPTPRQVAECENPQPYYFLDVEDGPYNAYGAGEDTYTLSFDLPEGAELLEFHLYYGYRTRGLTINDRTFSPQEVYAAFPLNSGTYVNIAEPSRHSPVNNNPQAVAPYFRAGANTFVITVSAEKPWEERPFDLFARFRVPSP